MAYEFQLYYYIIDYLWRYDSLENGRYNSNEWCLSFFPLKTVSVSWLKIVLFIHLFTMSAFNFVNLKHANVRRNLLNIIFKLTAKFCIQSTFSWWCYLNLNSYSARVMLFLYVSHWQGVYTLEQCWINLCFSHSTFYVKVCGNKDRFSRAVGGRSRDRLGFGVSYRLQQRGSMLVS